MAAYQAIFNLEASTIAQNFRNEIVYKLVASYNYISMPIYALKTHKQKKCEKTEIQILKIVIFFEPR